MMILKIKHPPYMPDEGGEGICPQSMHRNLQWLLRDNLVGNLRNPLHVDITKNGSYFDFNNTRDYYRS